MENQTSFDLNQQLIAWRENLAQSPAFGSENLDELEIHLRDSIGRLQAGGLSEEEAFGVAMKRVGTASSLAREYGKANPQAVWIDRLFWMLVGLQLWSFVNAFFTQTFYYSTMFLAEPNPASVEMWMDWLDLITLTASLGGCWWLIMRKGPVAARWISRSSFQKVERALIILFLGVIAANWLPTILLEMMNRIAFANHTHLLTTLIFRLGQPVALFICTLALARKRASLRKTMTLN